MKAIILAGGLGTRLSEETHLRPKPMVEIGGHPILWHVMKIYAAHGINEFIICAGYKGHMIKEYFQNYFLHNSDVTFDLATNQMTILRQNAESWKVTVVDTGEQTMTGGRLRRARELVGPETFCLTYGDGVGDIPVAEVIAFHRRHGGHATVEALAKQHQLHAFRHHGFWLPMDTLRDKAQLDNLWASGAAPWKVW